MTQARRQRAWWLATMMLSLAAPAGWAEPTLAAVPPSIRVAVIRNQPEIALAVHGPFRILALHTAEALREASHLSEVPIRATAEGILMGQDLLPLFGVRIEPSKDATINVNGQRLRGTLEIVRQADLTLLVINHIGIEEYLQGVLNKEAPYYWPMEALKTLAIVARTYALSQRLSKASVEYDVTGDVLSQLYGGRSAESRRTTRAVQQTAGVVLTYHGQIFPAFYHSTCGGLTERGSVMGPAYDLEPLRGGVACAFCVSSPFYRWQRVLTKADVAWALKQKQYGSVGVVNELNVVERSPTGRAQKVAIRGSQRTVMLSGYDFRALFGFDRLRSTAFTVRTEGDRFVLEGRGWGHGVGLCQWGTAALARRGLSAEEIVQFYYPQAKLARLEDVVLPSLKED